jgi:hypothetical protein
MGSECEIKSYSLDNFKFLMLDKNSALITFTAMQDGVCSGKTIPANVRASAIYVKRGGKWLVAKVHNSEAYLNWVIGGIFTATALIQLYKILTHKDAVDKIQNIRDEDILPEVRGERKPEDSKMC